MARSDIIKAVLTGAEKANRTFSEWSGGAWLCDYGVEGFMVSEICRSIRKVHTTGYLTMEEPFNQMMECTGKLSRGRKPEIMGGSKRVDIALWNSREYVTHVIEVKRQWNQESPRDLERLVELQRKLTTVQCGLFVLLVTAWGGRKALDEKVEQTRDAMWENLPTDKYRFHYGRDYGSPHHEGDWRATSLCVEVYGRQG
ncbi:hypothetical protein BerOc1_01381 [Pseudodesulfovibrio hydrargyri]|uniref:Uncharacterized protein n=1 Tax=Pseudodesulfovibrio hydrargyri TaxID=2125990 RepID=A0A1J5N3Q5_9BACT|nr:hypothetical protein [Pseudodesulfovibrio hydrargyri]OIQ49456.1 hypothetical protein BerOc1_01381 [Pseudodesulfovibrio hydrargyri]